MNETWVTGSFDPLINTFLLLSCKDKSILPFYPFKCHIKHKSKIRKNHNCLRCFLLSTCVLYQESQQCTNVASSSISLYQSCNLECLPTSHHLIILVFLMILSPGSDGRSLICVTDYVWVGKDDQKVLVVFLSDSLNYYWLHLSARWIFHQSPSPSINPYEIKWTGTHVCKMSENLIDDFMHAFYELCV